MVSGCLFERIVAVKNIQGALFDRTFAGTAERAIQCPLESSADLVKSFYALSRSDKVWEYIIENAVLV